MRPFFVLHERIAPREDAIRVQRCSQRSRMAQTQPGVLLLFPRGRLQLPGNCLQLLLSACKLRLHVLPGKRLHRFVQPIIA